MTRIVTLGPLSALGALVVLALVLGFGATPSKAGDGVCLSEPMDFADKSVTGCLGPQDADALMDRSVKLGENKGDQGVELSHPTDSAQQRKVHTCREYEAAVHDGWFALSTVDMTMEGFFKQKCGLLHALAHAKAARASFISAPLVGIGNLDLISAQTISALVPGAQGSIRTMVDAGAVSVEAHGPRKLRLSTNDQFAELSEIARGDFDGDGTEDVFVLLAVHAKGGTMRSYQTMILSRHSADGMFEVTPVTVNG